jgi:hypothetical protein
MEPIDLKKGKDASAWGKASRPVWHPNSNAPFPFVVNWCKIHANARLQTSMSENTNGDIDFEEEGEKMPRGIGLWPSNPHPSICIISLLPSILQ